MEALKEDLSMLKKFNMMDYSLLLCVQENPRYSELKYKQVAGSSFDTEEFRNELQAGFEANRHSFISECGKFIYRVGIIDYLQDFSTHKYLEYVGKVFVLQMGRGISCVPPGEYAERYLRFMKTHVIIDQKDEFMN